MSEPVCAQKSPYALDVKAGDYYWCACGKSAKQPFCDGAHKGSEFTPVQFSVAEDTKMYLCGCKRTANQPSCDGTHKSIEA